MKIIYSDLHLYSPIEIMRSEVLGLKFNRNTKLLGDIVDNANADNKIVSEALEVYKHLKNIHGSNYISGNHERATTRNEIIVEDGIIFAHGDLESDPERWIEYRQKPHGAGWFKRTFIIPFIREAEEIINRKPKIDFLNRASYLAKLHNCKTYVCGHFHIKKVIELMHEGIKIIIVPRGKTILDI